MRIVVGLGNPGKRYEATPHNIGFMVVDHLARDAGGDWKRSLRFKARTAKVSLGAETVLLVKPQTYMNNSGLAVGGLLRFHKIERSDLVVVMDDADLELGRLRIRARGSAGGHRGLASVIEHVGGDAFARVRLGIGRRNAGGNLVNHVLSGFDVSDREVVEGTVTRGAEAVCGVVRDGVNEGMNRFNGLPPVEKASARL